MASAPEGGSETMMLDSVLALAAAGVTQYVVTRPNNEWRLKQFANAGIGYATAGLNPNFTPVSRRKLSRVIGRFQPDIIQFWKARAGRFTFEKYRAKSVAWHGNTARYNRLKGCDWHIAASPRVGADLLDEGVNEDRLAVIAPFAGGAEAAPLDRTLLGVPDRAPLAVTLARLHQKKGLDTLIEAARSVQGLYVLIAGDGELKKALSSQIAALGLQDRVKLLGWRNDRGALFAAADFVVCPSRNEPFGKIVLDAWAAGKPIISTDASGPAMLITPDETGILVRRNDDEALANAMQRLIDTPALAAKLSENGPQAYEAEYGRDLFLEQTLAFYERVMGS